MATLMDRINKGMSAQPTQSSGPGQKQIEQVLRAKGGKAGAGAGAPAASGLQAATAEQQAQSQLRQGGLQGALAGAQMKQQSEQIAEKAALGEKELKSRGKMARERMRSESKTAAAQREARSEQARLQRSSEENMRIDAMQANATQRLRDLATQRDVSLDNIFGDFDRSNKQLELRKDQAELEQLGFEMAMSDRSYLDELNRVGRERMLTNELQFSQESARITLGDQLESVLQKLDWSREYNADRRSWEEKLGMMTINDAMDIYEGQVEAANQQALIQGVGQAAQSGYSWGAKKGHFGEPAKKQEYYKQTGATPSMEEWENL